MNGAGKVGTVARLLGYAGLLPQVALTILIAFYPRDTFDLTLWAAFIYASLILSFLGGTWWAIAMQRTRGQAGLAAVAVIPSTAPFVILLITMSNWQWPLIALGSGIIMTLLVDRRLVTTREAPVGWMALRVPLSLGLGLLTITAGLLVGLR